MPPGTAATFRGGHPSNGVLSPEPSLHRMPSDSPGSFTHRKSSTGTSQMRFVGPMLVLVAVALLVLVNTGSWVHSSTARPEQLTQTIEQLSQNQAAMMQMLQQLSHNGSGGTAAAAGAGAAAGTQQAKTPSSQEDASALPAAFAAIPALTTLHNQLLRSSHSYEQHRAVMRDTLNHLVHLEPEAALQEIKQQLEQPQSDQHMQLFTYRLYKLLLSTGKLIPCREDSTLVVEDPELAAATHHSSHHLHLWGHHKPSTSSSSASGSPHHVKYYFATNLRDNSVNMPQYILSLLQTLLRLPLGSVFVSAYESNSDDGAHGWVDVLQLALNVIGTPSRLVTRGMLVRLEGSNRIQHLARVRNMALAPLYQHYAAARDKAANGSSTAAGSGTGARKLMGEDLLGFVEDSGSMSTSGTLADMQETATSTSSSSSSSSRRLQTTVQLEAVASVDDAANLPPGVLPWDPDYIVFVNDAFFCWGMIIRLLNYKADITCGMDFWQNPDATVELPSHLSYKSHKPKPHIPPAYKLERPINEPNGPNQQDPIVFYDVWVARDLSGQKFWWTYPFVHDEGTRQAAAKGLPFRATCCWNGLAVLKAAPFKAGLRIRPPMQGECQGSECTMVCNDFARLGHDYVVVDAGVQLTYDWHLAREMMAVGIEGYGQSTWAQAKAAGIADRQRKPDYSRIECCGLKSRFTQWVNFNTDCADEDIMATNWTNKVLHGHS